MSRPLSIVVIDDHPIIRLGLVQALRQEDGFTIVGEGASLQEATALLRERAPDVLLVDAAFCTDLERIAEVAAARRATRIVILTAGHKGLPRADQLDNGVFHYALKGMTATKLREAIRIAYNGRATILPSEIYLPAATSDPRPESDRSILSKQEVQVLLLVATGLNNKEVAHRLNVVEKTVKFHLSRVFSKLDVRNRVEASILAREMWPDLTR